MPLSTSDTILVTPAIDFPEATKRYLKTRPTRTPYSDTDVDYIVRMYVESCMTGNVDVELALTQMVHETAALTSEWSQPPRRNPAGIGVTGAVDTAGNPVGQFFPTWLDAVQAHVGLLLAYRFAAGGGNAAQKRLIDFLVSYRPGAPRGVGQTIAEMAVKWAADTTYADKLVAVSAAISKA